MDKFDVHVKTILNSGPYINQLNEGITYSSLFKKKFRGTVTLFKLCPSFLSYRFVVRENYDIIISFLEGMTARILSGCRSKNIRKIAWIHTAFNSKHLYSKCFRGSKDAKKCYEKFDVIACVSQQVKEKFEQCSGLYNRCRVIYNTNDTDAIEKDSKQEPLDFTPDTNKINICSVGKLEEVKGYDRLIPVLGKINTEISPIHLFLFGKGSQRKKLEELAKANGFESGVTFMGYKANPYSYMSRCDLYVCSSYREGFSTSVTEALVLGMPILSTDCSGAKEMLGNNNEYGIVVDNSSEGIYRGLKQLLTTNGLLDYYKKQAKSRGKFFSKDKTVKAVEDMLFSLL